MKVLILGCGPAGLMAAHAAIRERVDPIILSRKRKSPMRGAQYLHRPIPGMPAFDFKIRYNLVGPVNGYRTKVYGVESDVPVSPDSLLGTSKAWDIRAVYNVLWDSYRDLVVDWDATPEGLFEAQRQYQPNATISTIPAPLLCWRDHEFSSAAIRVSEFADWFGPDEDNEVICSGLDSHRWYRQSRILGHENTEYPYRSLEGSLLTGPTAVVKKPITNNCTCFPAIRRMGRFGKWEKGVLSDTAFFETVELIRGFQTI